MGLTNVVLASDKADDEILEPGRTGILPSSFNGRSRNVMYHDGKYLPYLSHNGYLFVIAEFGGNKVFELVTRCFSLLLTYGSLS